MSQQTRLEIGAQTQAANDVTTTQQDFSNLLRQLDGELSNLRAQYLGQSGQAFFNLAYTWMQGASRQVEEFQVFAERLTSVDRATSSSEEEATSTLNSNVTELPRMIG